MAAWVVSFPLAPSARGLSHRSSSLARMAATCARCHRCADALEVVPWSPSVGWRRHKGTDEGVLLVREMNPAHASRLVHPTPVLEPPLCARLTEHIALER